MSNKTYMVTKEGNQISRLSPDFRDALREVADGLAAKKAQIATGSPDEFGQSEKKSAVDGVYAKFMEFSEHHVRDWLLSLDEVSLHEMNRMLDEVNGVSTSEFSGGGNPLEALTSMMGSKNPEQPEIVVEEELTVPPVAPDGTPQQPKEVTHEERIPLEEGMKPGMSE